MKKSPTVIRSGWGSGSGPGRKKRGRTSTRTKRPIQLIGIIGHPISHTLSPVMQNAALVATRSECRYLPFDVHPRDLGRALAGLAAIGCKGLNVTVPHKRAVLPHLDGLSQEARLIGAVNTIEFRGSRMIGHNTDGRGFSLALQSECGVRLKNKVTLLIGAGGAARAVGIQLLTEGVNRLTVTNRTRSRAQQLVRDLRKFFPRCEIRAVPLDQEILRSSMNDVQLVINATSVGMDHPPQNPLPGRLLRSDMVVCDLIYQPPMTPLLREARKVGAKGFNGISMLLWQGFLAFEIWMKTTPPVEVMRGALLRALRHLSSFFISYLTIL